MTRIFFVLVMVTAQAAFAQDGSTSQPASAPVAEVSAATEPASTQALSGTADLIGGGTIGSGSALRLALSGGVGLMRGYFGLEGDWLFALSQRIDLGVSVHAGFSQWVALTPAVKLRVGLVQHAAVGLALEAALQVPILIHTSFGTSPGVAADVGLSAHWQFSQSSRLLFGVFVQPQFLFNFYPSSRATYIGITPRLGLSRAIAERTHLYVMLDLTPTIDLTVPVPNPRVPLFGVNIAAGANFGI